MKTHILQSAIIISIILLSIIAPALIKGNDVIHLNAYAVHKLNEGEKIKVVITFNESSRNNIKNSLAGKKIKNHISPAITLVVDKEELDQLISNPDILSIKEEIQFHTAMQETLPLINATSSWNLQLNSINLTGKGESICIIDTGVNFSHSALGGCYGNNSLSSNCKIWGGVDWCADDGASFCSEIDDLPYDVNGHGTQVAGITSGNNTMLGIAPMSRVIMFKAADSSGDLDYYDVVDGINWCASNASKFNITVISMSIGGGLYSDYCDYDVPELVDAVNAAIAKNVLLLLLQEMGAVQQAFSSQLALKM